ncbi:MAG: 2,3,4,5-tetrahydropyridine-2,6-dicarboxylate N-succinyltransferase [Chloroflexi bacterium]|nr:2,3,4,5-tetrahydropyridine-2,6-dicarboxylate N-succinyltransferase [Chloroflexota bacterium]
MTVDVLAELEAGRLRAAGPDPDAPGGWRVEESVKAAILERFADGRLVEVDPTDAFRFVDRAGLPVRHAVGPGRRVVPGGTTLRAGAYLGERVVIMPPSYVNVGAWIGDGTMVDSHVLVGSCAQVGAGVHLSAGVTIGGVLEPPGARPVVIEDGAFIGAGSAVLEGVVVKEGAVIGAGVTLTATTRLYDLVEERVLAGTPEAPLVVPARAVVIPGARRLPGAFAQAHGLSATVAVIAKMRDGGTDARTSLEEALR